MKTVKTDIFLGVYLKNNPNFTGIVIDRFQDKCWVVKGNLHREDGPAIEYYHKERKDWYQNNELHREDGPAIEWADGYKAWYRNGKLHREEGPAIEDSENPEQNEYHLEGQFYSKEGWANKMRERKLSQFLDKDK